VEFAHLFPGEGPDGTFHGFNLGHCGSVSGVHVPARMERRECRRRWWDNPEIGDAGAVGQWGQTGRGQPVARCALKVPAFRRAASLGATRNRQTPSFIPR
jgi:hypothetical protein